MTAAYGRPADLPRKRRDHALQGWRREHGLGDAKLVPRTYDEWLATEDRRLGRDQPIVGPNLSLLN